MATLTGTTIQSTYDSLLKVSDNDAITSTLKRITDGLGNNTPLFLSTSAVQITSALSVTGTITGSNLSGTNTGDETKSSIETKLGAASASNSGFLTSTDWSSFNNKVAGIGTLNKLAKFSSSSSIADSNITDTGSAVTIGVATSVTGSLTVSSLIRTGGTSSQFLKADGSVDSTSYTPTSRTLTINGTTFDLSADRSWTITAGITGSGTAGRIPLFATSTSLGDSQIFTANDESIGQMIGIGATPNNAPTPHRLFVSGTSYFTNALRVNAGITATSYVISGGNNNQLVAAGGGVVTAGTNITISGGTISANNTSQWTTSGSNIFYNTGNVGIGTTSPAYTLDVKGLTYITPASGYNVLFQSSGTTLRMNYLNDAGSANVSATYRATDFAWQKGDGVETMRITSAGNVGIGTTSPSQRLTIGDGSGTGNQYLRINSSSSDIYIGQSGSGLFGLAANAAQNIAADNTSNPLAIGTIGPQPFILGTNNNERMRITSGGNVGINTTNPYARLMVQVPASATDVHALEITNATDASFAVYLRNNITSLYAGGAGNMTFSNSTERMRLTSGGSFAINTLGGPATNNTTFSVRSLTSTATDRAMEAYSISFLALFYVQNNGSYFFAGSNLSDKRTKKDINYLNDSVLEKVMQLKPASFKYIQNDENVKGGFIAQDVKEIFPDLVTKTQSEEDMMGVDYYGVIGILTKAIQELKQEIEELKNK